MKKKKYIIPEIIVISIANDDVISCSGPFDPFGMLEEDSNDIIDLY